MSKEIPYPHLRHNLVIHAGDQLGMTTSCISCLHFDEASEICKAFKQRPPARIIAFGCKTYEDKEEIPF